MLRRGEHRLGDIELTEKRVRTNVAMVHEAGHPEPLDHRPVAGALGPHGLRLWPALGHRGHVLRFQEPRLRARNSQIRLPRRLDRLILVMALALFWAVSTGMWDAAHRPTGAEKNPPSARPRSYARSLTSLFKRGLRRIHACLHLINTSPTSLDQMAHPPN